MHDQLFREHPQKTLDHAFFKHVPRFPAEIPCRKSIKCREEKTSARRCKSSSFRTGLDVLSYSHPIACVLAAVIHQVAIRGLKVIGKILSCTRLDFYIF